MGFVNGEDQMHAGKIIGSKSFQRRSLADPHAFAWTLLLYHFIKYDIDFFLMRLLRRPHTLDLHADNAGSIKIPPGSYFGKRDGAGLTPCSMIPLELGMHEEPPE